MKWYRILFEGDVFLPPKWLHTSISFLVYEATLDEALVSARAALATITSSIKWQLISVTTPPEDRGKDLS